MKPIAITALAALTLLVGAALVSSAHGGSAAVDEGITVTGTGSVEVVPDRAQFTFEIEAQAPTAQQALANGAVSAQRVVEALRGAGIARSDLQTAQISLQPRRTEQGAADGYVASTSVTAALKELGKAGKAVDAAVRAGATGFYGPSLTKSGEDALSTQALQAAVANARTKAQTLAAAAGVPLGRVTNVVEGSNAVPVYARGAAFAQEADVSVEPGTQQVTATVTMTFAAG